jgi:hypothetical protein
LAQIFLETLAECTATAKAALICMHIQNFPRANARQHGFIDVWWIVHDGGLLLLLAHLLSQVSRPTDGRHAIKMFREFLSGNKQVRNKCFSAVMFSNGARSLTISAISESKRDGNGRSLVPETFVPSRPMSFTCCY